MDNPQLELARRLIEGTGVNLFLTGKAGTGKTTFLRDFRDRTSKRVVVVAPTGIAAINAGGVTIHSFFQLSFSPYVPGLRTGDNRRYDRFSRDKLRVIRTMDVLVIDEMSMVRADLLDAIDASLRRHRDPTRPFGGVQLLMIGDMQQLPPVVKDDEAELLRGHYPTNYFFDSHALREAGYETVELTQVYRQKDEEFLRLLNRVRSNTADQSVINELNRRYMPGFVPPPGEGYIRLTTHNRLASEINQHELDRVQAPAFTFEARVAGDFPETSFPADRYLVLKEGAQVMFIKNDSSGMHRYYNGMIGHVTAITSSGIEVRPVEGNQVIEVEPEEWENNKYSINPETNALQEEVTGTFSQYPLRLAWAITIHKSQGLTFDHAVIDAAAAFAHGQTYVALSRCRTLEGLVLERPLSQSAVINDNAVTDFVSRCADMAPDEARMAQLARAYTLSLLGDLFGMRRLRMVFDSMHRTVMEGLANSFPKLAALWQEMSARLQREDQVTSPRFMAQLRGIMEAGAPDTDFLNQRVVAAARYFGAVLADLATLLDDTPTRSDNRDVQTRLMQRSAEVREVAGVKARLLSAFASTSFNAAEYLRLKAEAVLALDGAKGTASAGSAKSSPSRSSRTHSAREADDWVPSEITNKALFKELLGWRRRKMEETGESASRIVPTPALARLADSPAATLRQLSLVKGLGGKRLDRYGEELLEICRPHAGKPEIDEEQERRWNKYRHLKSYVVSIEMLREGMSVDKIAEERLLAPSTIGGHLVQGLAEGRVKLHEIVPAKDVPVIMTAIKEAGLKAGDSTSPVFVALGEKYPHYIIRAVAVDMGLV